MNHIHITELNIQEALQEAVAVLQAGGLVMYPTETMYGIGVDAANPEAVSKVFRYKNRPAGKSISVIVANKEAAEKIVNLNDAAENLYATFLPGPVTVISASYHKVDSRLESEFGTLGIRISSHPLAAQLAEHFAKPITATSANASGKARPYTVETALEGLSEPQKKLIDLVLDYGTLPRREPSSVIDTTQEVQQLRRAGEKIAELAVSFKSVSEEETIALGSEIMQSLLHVLPEKAVVIALEGEMGAGKTQFTKGVANALKINDQITSPTYTLMKEYVGTYANKSVQLVHIDCWRLENFNPADLGLAEYCKPYSVMVIEWATETLPLFKGYGDTIVLTHLLIEVLPDQSRSFKFLPV